MAVTSTVTDLIVIPQLGIAPERRLPGSAAVPSLSGSGFEMWNMSGSDIGEAGGGTMDMRFRLPQASQYYYTVTGIYTVRIDTGIDAFVNIRIPTADFDVYFGSNLLNPIQKVTEVEDNGILSSIKRTDLEPFYLGRAVTADSEIAVVWATNTDTVVYEFSVSGLRSLRPGIPPFNVLQQARLLN